MQRGLTRKEFLKVAGAGAAGGALLGASTLASSGCGPTISRKSETNVVVVIIDSLRKDHLGAYGNGWIKTPNMDALAKESLRFSRAYPESLPTICARRAIHTGMRTWPFRDRHYYKGVDIKMWGWQPIPEGQTTLSEILKGEGYRTLFVTDTLHQFEATMNFQRGFDVFDFIRGQTTDSYKPIWTYPPEKLSQAMLMTGESGMLRGSAYLRQYFANTAYRKTEKDWFSLLPSGVQPGLGVAGGRQRGWAVLPGGGWLRSPRAIRPARGVRLSLRRPLRGTRTLPGLPRSFRPLQRAPARADARSLRR